MGPTPLERTFRVDCLPPPTHGSSTSPFPLHCIVGRNDMESTRRVLGHSLPSSWERDLCLHSVQKDQRRGNKKFDSITGTKPNTLPHFLAFNLKSFNGRNLRGLWMKGIVHMDQIGVGMKGAKIQLIVYLLVWSVISFVCLLISGCLGWSFPDRLFALHLIGKINAKYCECFDFTQFLLIVSCGD